MKVLFVDGYNLLHRARYGFSKGKWSTTFNFFKSFRSIVGQIPTNKIIVALEGRPDFRYKIYPEYKANRKKTLTPELEEEIALFKKNKEKIFDILKRLPIELLKHPNYEGDDVIGRLISTVYKNDKCFVVTADTDFIQLLNLDVNVTIYNPIKKTWTDSIEYNYVLWKSLVGDTADNIKGINRVGPKTARKLLELDKKDFEKWLSEKPERKAVVERNLNLIKFANVPIEEIDNLSLNTDFDWIREKFTEMEFKTITSDKSWKKFKETFIDLD